MTAVEQLEERLQALGDELDDWAGGNRSWCDSIPYPGSDPSELAAYHAAVAMKDAAHVMALAAQLTSTAVLLQMASNGEQS